MAYLDLTIPTFTGLIMSVLWCISAHPRNSRIPIVRVGFVVKFQANFGRKLDLEANAETHEGRGRTATR